MVVEYQGRSYTSFSNRVQLSILHNDTVYPCSPAHLLLVCLRPQDLAVQNSRVEGRAWTWAVQGPSSGCISTDEWS